MLTTEQKTIREKWKTLNSLWRFCWSGHMLMNSGKKYIAAYDRFAKAFDQITKSSPDYRVLQDAIWKMLAANSDSLAAKAAKATRKYLGG